MPQMKPSTSFARRDLKNEPCPQSWKIINVRTMNPPAKTASGMVIHREIERLKYIRHQSSTYGPRVLTSCHTARPVEGCWYLETISFQSALPVWRSLWPEMGPFNSFDMYNGRGGALTRPVLQTSWRP